MSQHQESRVFGKRRPDHFLILASGEKVRHMRIRPWMTGLGLTLLGAVSVGYLAATAYLVLRDDLIGATMARQARMQFEYEDRIAALRAQVDRVTSRQMLDQQVVEDKVEKLLEQQNALASRHGKIGPLLERAEASGISAPETAFQAEPAKTASAGGGLKAIDALMGKAEDASAPVAALGYQASAGDGHETAGDRADKLFSRMTLSLKSIEQDQLEKVESLTAGATQTADEMETIMQRTGIPIETQATAPAEAAGAEGGPYVDPMSQDNFDLSLSRLDSALNRLEEVKATAKRLPFTNPAPGRDITSTFGNRTDPFLGKLAMHTGVDFRFETGEEVVSTGAGKVTVAGAVGGYGNMVEIDHGNGITTRYGHLSRILVSVGDAVENGSLIGRAGSTGRSTGPHLHYEVRYQGEPENPMRFINAAAKLNTFLR
ncbi:peptidoglycan DD-metalloendopeptidase family protein [Gellertiella hungarica]|uniref:Murein DD-endopeptidase MepM/ murein hydrolase activator NlpD n=1 Tax=Gellertiella hungarica TaxID=1572859 RepID=A0A7W6J4H9_9HYPH|nr:murein DD-endopeptidase MepM/ murein hydrolase activator NlpD [Gellertiella hungarica]